MTVSDQANTAIRAEQARRAAKKQALGSTVGMGLVTGSNAYDPLTSRYPWVDFQEYISAYFDQIEDRIGLPIKLIAASRGHLKTEIGVNAITRFVLNNPERKNCIIGSTHDRSKKNLAHINGILQGKKFQAMFPETLYPTGSDHYTKEELLVRRTGNYRENTIETLGRGASMAGKHYNGVIWIDDIISEQDDFEKNPQISEDVMDLLEHIIEAVADPGCEIWFTFTRYHIADPYARILEDEEYDDMIVRTPDGRKGVILDCFKEGGGEAIYPFRHCMEKEDEVADVEFRGTTYKNVKRKSLVAMEKRVKPTWWYSQMKNAPMVGSAVGFAKHQFDSVLPVTGDGFESWLMNLTRDQLIKFGLGESAAKGMLITHILGDPAYGDKRTSDYSVLWVVSQTVNNHWIIRDAYRGRLGYQGDEQLARMALGFKSRYNALQLAIEKHAKESIGTVFKLIGAEEGLNIALFDLPNNSNKGKKDRIATLIPITSEGRLHFCQNVENERLALQDEAWKFPSCCDGGHNMHDDCLDGLANGTQVFEPRRVNMTGGDAHKWRGNLPEGVRRILGGRRRVGPRRGNRY